MSNAHRELIDFARTTRSVITYLAGGLALLFGWLEFKDVAIGQIVGSVSGGLIVKIALSIYYLSWVAGTINDVDQQETAYAEAPNAGRFPRSGFLVAISVAAAFAILCYVSSAQAFSLVLAFFLVLNVAGYLYILRTIKPTVEKSRQQYLQLGDRSSLAKLEIVWRYLGGAWQWWRFAYGLMAIGLVVAASFSQLPQRLHALYSEIPPENYIALSVLLYVLSMEGWIWAMRLWARIAQDAVDLVLEILPPDLKTTVTTA